MGAQTCLLCTSIARLDYELTELSRHNHKYTCTHMARAHTHRQLHTGANRHMHTSIHTHLHAHGRKQTRINETYKVIQAHSRVCWPHLSVQYIVYLYPYMYAYTHHNHTYTCTHMARTHTHTNARAHTHTDTQTHRHTHTHTHTHT